MDLIQVKQFSVSGVVQIEQNAHLPFHWGEGANLKPRFAFFKLVCMPNFLFCYGNRLFLIFYTSKSVMFVSGLLNLHLYKLGGGYRTTV